MGGRFWRVLWVAVSLLAAVPGIAGAQEAIGFGQTVEGELDDNDAVTQGGSAFDSYAFTAASGQGYVVTGNSAALPLVLRLYAVDAETEALSLVQAAFVDAPGRQVQFSGVLDADGRYLLFVQSSQAGLLGGYTLGLAESTPAAGQCAGGTRAEPVQLGLGTPLDCEMTAGDVPFSNVDGETLYGKFFRVESTGGALTVRAASAVIVPLVQVYASPVSTEVVAFAQGEVTAEMAAGPVLFAVVNLRPEGTGPFTVVADVAAGP